ncbi:g504 [Coccomyxa elongata]
MARMVELFMVEPTFKGMSASGPTSDVIDLKMHEPLTTTSMRRTSSSSTSPIYVDDIRSKFLLAMRETRKNLILARYTKRLVQGKETAALMQKLQGDIDANRVDKIEKGMEEVYAGVVKPLVKELDDRVNNNLAAASERMLRMKDSYRAPISPLLSPSFTIPSAIQNSKSAVQGSVETPWF